MVCLSHLYITKATQAAAPEGAKMGSIGIHLSPLYRHACFLLIPCSFGQKPCSYLHVVFGLFSPTLKMVYLNISAYWGP